MLFVGCSFLYKCSCTVQINKRLVRATSIFLTLLTEWAGTGVYKMYIVHCTGGFW